MRRFGQGRFSFLDAVSYGAHVPRAGTNRRIWNQHSCVQAIPGKQTNRSQVVLYSRDKAVCRKILKKPSLKIVLREWFAPLRRKTLIQTTQDEQFFAIN